MFKDIKKRVKGYTPAKPLLPVFRRDKETTASPRKMEKQPAPREESPTQTGTTISIPPPPPTTGSSRSSLQQPPTPTTPIAFARLQSSSSLLSVGSDQLLDHSHLRPGANAELLSYAKTINMYRSNAKKTNNPEIQCDFAIFLVEASKRLDEDNEAARQSYLCEAEKLLKQVALRGHGESQYYLANMYAAGVLNHDKPEFDKAFPLYVQAAKHHNPDAAFRYVAYNSWVGVPPFCFSFFFLHFLPFFYICYCSASQCCMLHLSIPHMQRWIAMWMRAWTGCVGVGSACMAIRWMWGVVVPMDLYGWLEGNGGEVHAMFICEERMSMRMEGACAVAPTVDF